MSIYLIKKVLLMSIALFLSGNIIANEIQYYLCEAASAMGNAAARVYITSELQGEDLGVQRQAIFDNLNSAIVFMETAESMMVDPWARIRKRKNTFQQSIRRIESFIAEFDRILPQHRADRINGIFSTYRMGFSVTYNSARIDSIQSKSTCDTEVLNTCYHFGRAQIAAETSGSEEKPKFIWKYQFSANSRMTHSIQRGLTIAMDIGAKPPDSQTEKICCGFGPPFEWENLPKLSAESTSAEYAVARDTLLNIISRAQADQAACLTDECAVSRSPNYNNNRQGNNLVNIDVSGINNFGWTPDRNSVTVSDWDNKKKVEFDASNGTHSVTFKMYWYNHCPGESYKCPVENKGWVGPHRYLPVWKGSPGDIQVLGYTASQRYVSEKEIYAEIYVVGWGKAGVNPLDHYPFEHFSPPADYLLSKVEAESARCGCNPSASGNTRIQARSNPEDTSEEKFEGFIKLSNINFFESVKGQVDQNRSNFSRSFSAKNSRYIYFDIELDHPLQIEEKKIELNFIMYDPRGSEFYKDTIELKTLAGQSSLDYYYGIGWTHPGKWQPGEYRIEFFIGQRNIASDKFNVFEDRDVLDLQDVLKKITLKSLNFSYEYSGAPEFTNRFERNKLTYLQWFVQFNHPAARQRIEFSIEISFYASDGSLIGTQTMNTWTMADWTISKHNWGWGWSEPGNWPRGRNEAVIRVGGREIGRRSFEVY